MVEGLDVIIVDDDPIVGQGLAEMIKRFYTWGQVLSFSDPEEAVAFCQSRHYGVAIFVVDVFLGKTSGFQFLDALEEKFPTVHADTVIITGKASDDIVNMCIASNVNHLIEKPVRPFALQLAIRSIVSKYLHFAQKLLHDPEFAAHIARFQ
ncbi:MAG: response regulator [Desulfobacteraceae bacterium]|nr:MAG: response regulator [Desulfobacteraceae bacterium]